MTTTRTASTAAALAVTPGLAAASWVAAVRSDEPIDMDRAFWHAARVPADEEKPGHIPVVQVPAVYERNGSPMSQVLAYSDDQLEPALLLPAQFDQTMQVGGGNDPGWPGVVEAAR